MKLSKSAIRLMAVMVLPVSVMAQTATTRPDAARPDASGSDTVRPDTGRAPGRGGALAGASTRPYTPAEWDEMMAFLKVNSPLRAGTLRTQNPPDYLRNNMIRTYRAYKLIKDQNPEIAELRVQRFQIEDKIYGLTLELRRLRRPAADITEDIRTSVQQLVQLGLTEHELRIKRLDMLQADERTKLEQEKANAEATVQERTNTIVANARRFGGRGGFARAATQPSGGDDTPSAIEITPPAKSDKK